MCAVLRSPEPREQSPSLLPCFPLLLRLKVILLAMSIISHSILLLLAINPNPFSWILKIGLNQLNQCVLAVNLPTWESGSDHTSIKGSTHQVPGCTRHWITRDPKITRTLPCLKELTS